MKTLLAVVMGLIALTSCGSDKDNTPKSESSSLVTITSNYKDKSSASKIVSVKGSGFLVSGFKKLFVVTAAHVGSGENVDINYKGNKLKVLGNLYDGSFDVQIFEVESPKEDIPSMKVVNDFIEWAPEKDALVKYVDQSNFTLLNSWVFDPNLDADNNFSFNKKDNLTCDLHCVFLDGQTLMQPGSSGSPLVIKLKPETEWEKDLLPFDARETLPKVTQTRFFVRGVTVKRERFFSRSSFIPVSKVIALLKSYDKGLRTSNPEFVWNISGSLMFRSSTSLYESAAVAAGVGNGVSMDGGHLSVFNEDNPDDLLSKITSFPILDGRSSLYWVMAMRTLEGAFISTPVWFDLEHYQAMKRFTWALGSPDGKEEEYASYFMGLISKKPQAGLTRLNSQMLEVSFTEKDNEEIHFIIDKKGALCFDMLTCKEKFQPIIEAKGSYGNTYLVDLRGFLFVNPTYGHSNRLKRTDVLSMNSNDASRVVMNEFVNEINVSRIFYRKKRSSPTPMTIEEGQAYFREWTF